MKILKRIMMLAIPVVMLASCKKYQNIIDAAYPDQTVYFPAAVTGVSTNGIYSINAVAVPGYTFRYVADVAGKKLNIPLSVYRAGTTTKGSITASVAANTDTVNKFIAAGKFPAATEVLPSDKFTLGNSVTVADGQDAGDFILSVDLNFLLANPTKKYAIGVALANSSKGLAASSVAIVWIDPAFLVPTANFTTSISTRTVSFSNTSSNALSYIWDYGDGTPLSIGTALPHTYSAAGTYTIKLVSSGALGDFNKATYTSIVVIP